MNKKKLAFILTVALVAIGSFIIFHERSEGEPEVRIVHASYDTDVARPNQLYRAVDNMFIGKVRRQVRTHYIGGSVVPSTVFRVEVLHNIKGSLPRIVAVNQDGGYNEEEGAMVLLSGDNLLEPGEIYFFATKAGGNGKWHTLVPVYGNIMIDNEAERVSLVERFEQIDAKERGITAEH